VGDNFTAVYNREDNNCAKISLATPFLEVPRPHADRLFETLGVAKHIGDGPVDKFTVDCSKIDSMPAITINIGSGFGSIYYTVPAEQFVIRHPLNCPYDDPEGCKGVSHDCGILIAEKLPQASWNMPGNHAVAHDPDDVWVIGTQFLPKRCVHLDYANGEMSFADPLKRD
ncbi:hypothetical protein AAVH_19729, partial [Aphelenchoides avenae]